jgi:hypothetical protein
VVTLAILSETADNRLDCAAIPEELVLNMPVMLICRSCAMGLSLN